MSSISLSYVVKSVNKTFDVEDDIITFECMLYIFRLYMLYIFKVILSYSINIDKSYTMPIGKKVIIKLIN